MNFGSDLSRGFDLTTFFMRREERDKVNLLKNIYPKRCLLLGRGGLIIRISFYLRN